MVPAAGRGGAAEFPFYLCSIRRDDFALALICVVSGISRGSIGRGNSWDPTSLSALLLALIGQAHAQPALDDATPCSVAVSAFSSADKERMQAVANFIENAFEQLDRRYTENGEAGILNERLRSALVGAAVGFCRQHQNSTIFIEATNAYRGMRALQAPAGTQE